MHNDINVRVGISTCTRIHRHAGMQTYTQLHKHAQTHTQAVFSCAIVVVVEVVVMLLLNQFEEEINVTAM